MGMGGVGDGVICGGIDFIGKTGPCKGVCGIWETLVGSTGGCAAAEAGPLFGCVGCNWGVEYIGGICCGGETTEGMD